MFVAKSLKPTKLKWTKLKIQMTVHTLILDRGDLTIIKVHIRKKCHLLQAILHLRPQLGTAR